MLCVAVSKRAEERPVWPGIQRSHYPALCNGWRLVFLFLFLGFGPDNGWPQLLVYPPHRHTDLGRIMIFLSYLCPSHCSPTLIPSISQGKDIRVGKSAGVVGK